MAATGARRRWRRGRVQLTTTQIRIRRLLRCAAGGRLQGAVGGRRRTAAWRSTAGNGSLAQHCWELHPGAAGTADSSGQRRPGRVDPRRRMGSSQDPRGWPRNWTRSATADGQRRGSGRGRRRRARSPANGRRPDLGSGGADLDEGGERAAAGSGRRRRRRARSDGIQQTGGGRIRAAAGGIRADETAGGRAATAAEKTATAAKGTATAAGRRDGGWKKNLRNPNRDLL
jgi:hypothetical protein